MALVETGLILSVPSLNYANFRIYKYVIFKNNAGTPRIVGIFTMMGVTKIF